MSLHVHLDPVGGIAGDMFIAAMLAAFPEALPELETDLETAGVARHVSLELTETRKSGFAASQVAFVPRDGNPTATSHWSDIRAFLTDSRLAEPVKAIALEIFRYLAEAEAKVHGVPVDSVHFHEVADWDSVADIVAAASLIHCVGADSYSMGRVPIGFGRIATQHGSLPVPAPATTELLSGFEVFDDGCPGERVTPTGAAILKYLKPGFADVMPSGVLGAQGFGAGQAELKGIANILRVFALKADARLTDSVVRLGFEIDDMTPEELAVALDHLREDRRVLDAGFSLEIGKKGRPRFSVSVLVAEHDADAVCDLCFEETSTLGLRVQMLGRRILPREMGVANDVGIKRSDRPGGSTIKVEQDDIAGLRTLRRRREVARSLESNDEG